MNSQMLPVILENAEYEIERCLPFVIEGRGSAKLVFKLCRAYRRRGICSLFLRGSAIPLHQDLQRAGAAFTSALELYPGLLPSASKAQPFYDAIACQDLGIAGRIASLLPRHFTGGEEYEEDYYFISVLAALVLDPTAMDELNPLLNAFGESELTSQDPRLGICDALAARDSNLFAASMDRLLRTREQEYSQAADFEELIEDDWATEGQFFVEGLAVVRVAIMVGIKTEDNYLFIPSLAIDSSAADLSPVSWKEPFDSTAAIE